MKLALMTILIAGCQHASHKPELTRIAIISINDVYRTVGIDNGQTGGLARVRTLRKQLSSEYDHVLLLHAGDFLHPSFNSKQDNGASMIQIMNYLDGSFDHFDDDMLVVFGNHEFDKSSAQYTSLMSGLIANSEFTWLDSNIEWQSDFIQPEQLQSYVLKHYGQITIGVFGFTTDMQHPTYVKSFNDYRSTAAHYVPLLRAQGADIVIALTHHWLQDDIAMMKLPEAIRPDIIFGGHEHYAQTEVVNDRWIIKADADAASAAVVEITNGQIGAPMIVPLNNKIEPDPNTDYWVQRLDADINHDFCTQNDQELQCLDRIVGLTQVTLEAEETQIRRFETNLGNLLTDLAKNAFDACGADVALLNAGSIRLNQNIPAGSTITEKHLAEMFPYRSDLRLIEITGQTLQDMLNHSVSGWTANGHWLQVSGLAYIHDSEQQTTSHIHIKEQNQPINPEKPYRVVVPHYLISPKYDQDGYVMINEQMQLECPANGSEVAMLFRQYLAAHPNGIRPVKQNRICHQQTQNCY